MPRVMISSAHPVNLSHTGSHPSLLHFACSSLNGHRVSSLHRQIATVFLLWIAVVSVLSTIKPWIATVFLFSYFQFSSILLFFHVGLCIFFTRIGEKLQRIVMMHCFLASNSDCNKYEFVVIQVFFFLLYLIHFFRFSFHSSVAHERT
jgi:hypothetical protein